MRIAAMRLLALVVGALAVGAPLGAQQRRQKNVLTAEEIDHWKANMSTAYDVVSMNMGSAEFLKTIPLEDVLEMRWLSANETASRFGPTDGQAAIVVTLKR